MNPADFKFGFRTLARDGERKLTDWKNAFRAHVENDAIAVTDSECYLSMFQFGPDFKKHLEENGTPKGFKGPTWARFAWWDIDCETLEQAHQFAKTLAARLEMEFGLYAEGILIFFSGSKGFHVGLPTDLWNPEPSIQFHAITKAFCMRLAERAEVTIDAGVYSRVNLFRAPNSRHRKTGLFKLQLTSGELFEMRTDAIVRLAAEPREGYVPRPQEFNRGLADLWAMASAEVLEVEHANAARYASRTGARLNPTTRAVLADGVISTGDRHRELFSAAANFAEFSSVQELAFALLTPIGRNSGLSGDEVERQIRCGLEHGGRSRC